MKTALALALLPFLSMSATAADDLFGAWSVTAVAGETVDVGQTIAFFADGSISGEAGCNSFGGTAEVDGSKLTIGNVMSTLMACPKMDDEARFHDALALAKGWRATDDGVEIVDVDGGPLLSLAAAE